MIRSSVQSNLTLFSCSLGPRYKMRNSSRVRLVMSDTVALYNVAPCRVAFDIVSDVRFIIFTPSLPFLQIHWDETEVWIMCWKSLKPHLKAEVTQLYLNGYYSLWDPCSLMLETNKKRNTLNLESWGVSLMRVLT